MKSLNNYILEGIYGNLGIDSAIDKEALRDWIVNSYCPSVNNNLKSEGIIVGDKAGDPIINTSLTFQIITDPDYDVAPDGVLPEYCKNILFSKPVSHIEVKSDKRNPLRSFSNLPKDLHTDTVPVLGYNLTTIGLSGDYDTLDFSDIKSKIILYICKGINIKQILNITNCDRISFVGFTDLADVNTVLSTFKNCKFDSNQVHFDNPSNIQSSISLKTTSQSISEYIQLIQKLGLYCHISDADRHLFKPAKLPLRGYSGYIWLDINLYENLSYGFFKDINPNIIKLIKLTDNRNKNKNSIIPEENLKELPKGVMLCIPYDFRRVESVNYYRGFCDTLGAVVWTDYLRRCICFVKK